MADCDCGIGVLEQVADWAAHNIASAQHNRRLALGIKTCLFQQNHDTFWGAGNEKWLPSPLS